MGYFWLSKSATTTALDVSEILLLVFGLILTIGALGEYRKFPRLLKASHATFELLVVIGIAGELFADGGVFVFSRHIQSIDDAEVSSLNERLVSSNRLLAAAQRDVGSAVKAAGNANKDAGDAKERAGKLDVQAATLRKQVEDERIRRLSLQERVAWRTISPPEIASIGARLRAHKGVVIAIGTVAGNEEAVSLSEDLASLVRATDWRFLGVQPYGNLGVQRFGLRISATPDNQMRSAAEDLTAELNRLGFNPALSIEKAFDNGMPGIYLFVELRPRIVPVRSTAP